MLYELIGMALLLAILPTVFFRIGFREGYKWKTEPKKQAEAKIIPRKEPKHKETEEERQERMYVENVEAYCGTGKGQVEIK